MQEKKYINGIVLKEKKFDNGGSIINCWIKYDDFIKEIDSIKKNGSVNIVIAERKAPSSTGVTHYVYQDTFEPKQKQEPVHYEETEDDLPF